MMSKFTTKLTTIVAALGLAGLCSCSDEAGIRWAGNGNTTITASIDGADALTRTCIDPTEYDNGVVGVLWTPGDKLGVFGNGSTKNALFTNSSTTNVDRASFTGTLADGETPQYAYYPYSKANAGKAVTELTGTVSAEQTFDLTTGKLTDDWKYGSLKTSTSGGYEFTMKHLFAMAKVVIDATGSPVEGETLESIEVTLPEGRQLCGDFTFSAVDGSYTPGTCTNSVKMVWSDKPALTNGKSYTGYLTLIPDGVKQGDKITIKILTNQHQATFEVPCLVDFQKGTIYSMPMTLTSLANQMKEAYGTEPTYEEVGTTDPEPTVTTGTFTACAFNVDGLPSLINSDGPGSSGTTKMAGIANNLGWDIIAASEDFEYNSQLVSALTNYSHGTYRGKVSISQAFGSVADTDGLNFFWRTSTTSATGETFVEYNDKEGDLYNGANTCIKKGFRHYEVTVDAANNVVIDVYITHMNTYSGSGNTEDSNAYVKAVLSQLRQLRDYVLTKAKENKRPAIIMGDTNMRYTRHDIKTNFLDVVAAYDNNAGYTVSDPWVEFHRGGEYPSWNSKSLMIRAHANKDGLSSDIICADDQRGEVVDKIWYINVPGAEVQLKATAHKNDVDNFKKSTTSVTFSGATLEDANGNVTGNQSITYDKVVGYSDHFPVVTTFQWTKTEK
ncbi:MAG: hypothetical protein PUE36_06060 [Bacteroidales bacterium]|nr:hypothetical protein [Bacteroidales bacterium]